MQKRTLPLLFGATLFFLFCSLAAHFAGKFRISSACFDLCFLSFILFLIFQAVPKKLRKYLLGGILSLLVLSGAFTATHSLRSKNNLYQWILSRNEQGAYFELGVSPRPKEAPKAYLNNVANFHMNEIRDGYSIKEICPQFSRLSWDWFGQLQFIGVKYVVSFLNKKQAAPLNVEGIPVAAAFPDAVIFKVPKRSRVVSVLYGEKFTDEIEGEFSRGVKWMLASRGKIYLHNHLRRDIDVEARGTLVSLAPAEVEILNFATQQLLWQGTATPSGTDFQIQNMKLLPGKNILLLKTPPGPVADKNPLPLIAGEPGLSLGIKNLDVVYLGMAPSEVAAAVGKSWPENSYFETWLRSLPREKKVLEYPLAHENWRTPVNYGRNVNFAYDRFVPSFAAAHWGNVPSAEAVKWGKALGVDYIVVHRALYSSPPRVPENIGLKKVDEFDEAEIYEL